MSHFVIEYMDKTGSAALRSANREAHIAYRRQLGAALILAGPLFEDFDGAAAVGSLVILDAPDKAAAITIAESDPYAQAGVFASIRVHAHKILALNPPAT